MRVYHLLSAENGLSDIALKRIKIARLAEVNDPFELLAVNVGGQKQARAALREWKTATNEKRGLLSFSKSWHNPVLWSHYGDKHHGICLGFDVPHDILQDTNYAPERILAKFIDGIPPTFDAMLLAALLSTKYEHWRYEEETRIWVNLEKRAAERGLYFYPFSDDLQLREVILGPLCEYPIEQVRHLVQSLYESVVVIRARLAFKFFKVVPDERSVPQGAPGAANTK